MNKVPSLRFKEFSGEWEEKRLGEVSDIIMGQSPSSSEYNEEFKGLPLIQGNADCKNRKIYPRMYTTEITKESFPNDIIMTVRAPVGAISFSDIHSCIGRGVCAIRNANKFIYHYLIKLEDSWDKLAQGSTFTAVNSNDIKNLAVKFPCLKEQEKIADFLSSVDKKISIVEEKLNLFNQYKKGIMQKIFSQELRFKDENGNNYPEWEEKKLGEVSELTSSKRIFLSEYVSQGIPFYRGKEITDLKKRKVITDILYISNEKYEEILEKYGVPQRNDILITAVGTLGNVYRIPNNDKFYFKDGNLIWLKNIKVSSKYLEYDLEYHKKQILDSSIGSTQKALTIVNLNKISLNIPNIQEQKKIANFLSAIDNKIENISGNLESLKLFKKSLLQKMFV